MVLTPVDFVLIFLVTKPLFLTGCLLLVLVRHRRARQEILPSTGQRALPSTRAPRALLEEANS